MIHVRSSAGPQPGSSAVNAPDVGRWYKSNTPGGLREPSNPSSVVLRTPVVSLHLNKSNKLLPVIAAAYRSPDNTDL